MKQNTYTVQDIERYHSGGLSAAEMHSMEKAALDDPFLADSLEGYSHTKTASADLASLQQRLQARIQKEEDKKRVFFIGNSWMKIAALFILFAGGGWLVFQMFSDKKQELATNKTVQIQKPAEKINSKDSATVYSDAPNTNSVPLNQSQPVIKKNSNVEKKQNTLVANEEDLVILESKQNQNFNSPSVNSESSFDSLQTMTKKTFETSAFKKDSNGDSLLARSNGYEKEKSRAKNFENLSYRSNPSSIDKKLSGRLQGVKSDTIKNFDVVMQPAEMNEKVVVINSNRTVAKQEARFRMQVTVDTLEPEEGWEDFGNYMANNSRSPERFRNSKSATGEVELSFEVNKQGDPVNIKVTKSLCDECDEEAVRLLKEGPKWKKNKKKGKVKIKF